VHDSHDKELRLSGGYECAYEASGRCYAITYNGCVFADSEHVVLIGSSDIHQVIFSIYLTHGFRCAYIFISFTINVRGIKCNIIFIISLKNLTLQKNEKFRMSMEYSNFRKRSKK